LPMSYKSGNYGSFGAIAAAAACPICFPKLALLGAFFVLGALAKFEVVFLYSAHILVVFALIGHVISYKNMQNRILLGLATTSAALFFISLYTFVSEMLSYVSLAGLAIATIWMKVEGRHRDSCGISTT
jgi:hypothetical protein